MHEPRDFFFRGYADLLTKSKLQRVIWEFPLYQDSDTLFDGEKFRTFRRSMSERKKYITDPIIWSFIWSKPLGFLWDNIGASTDSEKYIAPMPWGIIENGVTGICQLSRNQQKKRISKTCPVVKLRHIDDPVTRKKQRWNGANIPLYICHWLIVNLLINRCRFENGLHWSVQEGMGNNIQPLVIPWMCFPVLHQSRLLIVIKESWKKVGFRDVL